MRAERRVLGVVHNITAATRLLDVIGLVAGDARVLVEFTVPGSSAFTEGTEAFLATRGIRVRPWTSARSDGYHLAIIASLGGDLGTISANRLILPHGMGYNKYLPRETGKQGNRETGKQGNRETGKQGNRETGAEFGFEPRWLVAGGELIPHALVLSHVEQRTRLAAACPEAVGVSVVGGDPVLDRLRASVPLRPVYRRALGVEDGQRLVVLSSTWGSASLLGTGIDLVRRFARLPLDEYRVVTALHPNIAAWHGEWQLRNWLRECSRAGITLLPQPDDWQAAVVAADVVVGDQGSVTFYSAALDRPVLLAVAPLHTVTPASPIGRFLRRAPLLDDAKDLAKQLDDVITTYDPTDLADLTALATSAPDESAALLRSCFYNLMDLSEPPYPAEVRAVSCPDRLTRDVEAQLVQTELTGLTVAVTRFPALLDAHKGLPPNTHLVVSTREPLRRYLELAEIILVPDAADATEVLRGLPGCALAAGPVSEHEWLVVTRDGNEVYVTGLDDASASVVHAWLTAHGSLVDLPCRLSVRHGNRLVTAEFKTPTSSAARG
ncbi:hypothetical protein [Actinokineospora inagensis]|uniref:hypothetical protein n=1 Tax=Actinokineospora inagensis TaxID=103730 RepID=UPI0012FC62FE|nr:hypothetical protein [Actinokineospora inagensis]